ncbi:choline transporter-like protein 1 isoform X2 [Pomacea canaliculata]|uniref:choline transporter-like protein 1 isoform X2 n=1 Tax=Pomacea canaliculata TaxID=400727 RepID=UPI000D729D26|nr:choline transporter-like protein 1 isoform X2 [Pomacea canaliculata]XP_025109659.1 choline transporter-like protein 1 isoform X2 [Pomacea canaliculata]
MGGAPSQVVQPVKGEHTTGDTFDGPTKNRECRDVLALVLFLAFLGGLGYVFWYAVDKGNPCLLIYATDSYGNVCNQKNKAIPGASESGRDTTDRPKLFYFDKNYLKTVMDSTGTTKVESVMVCVRMCPNETLSDLSAIKNFYNSYGVSICNYNAAESSFVADGTVCPKTPVEKHTELLNRCIPESLSSAIQGVNDALKGILNIFGKNFGENCAEDLRGTWRDVIYLSLTGLGASIVMLVLLHFLAAVLVWTVVLLVALGSVAGAAFCWYTYSTDKTETWLGISIAATIIAVIILLILLVMRKRIKLVVQLFKEADKAVTKMPCLLLQPFMTLLILGGSLAGFCYIFLFFVTARNPVVDDKTGFVSFEQDSNIKGLFVYYLLGLLWVTQFIVDCERLTVSSAVALWYFTRDKSSLASPISTSFYRLIRFHLGSVAFGSLIIAIVILIRWILSYINGRLKGSSSLPAKFLLKCMICCLWCFENVLKFLSSNAYIEIAIYGYGFCKAARKAFMVIASNALRVAAINSVGDFVLFLAKVGIVTVVVVVGIELFRGRDEVHYVWLPITLASIVAYIIASCFLGVYEMIIDAVFICFVEDCEMNDGVSKPYFMSMGLMKFLENSSAENIQREMW